MPPPRMSSMTEEERKCKRRTESNRETARRSRARKQEQLHDLLHHLLAVNARVQALIREYEDKLAELHNYNLKVVPAEIADADPLFPTMDADADPQLDACYNTTP